MRAAGAFRAHAAYVAALFFLLLCGAGTVGGAVAGPPPWKESTPGLLRSLPERNVEALDNGVRASFKLAPGQGIVLERDERRPVDNGATLALELTASGTNPSSRDYVPGKAAFAVAVTVVFGDDTVGRPFRSLLYDFFTGPWYGLFSRGIRLTYAWGNDAPVMSMYRLVEDETVFILAGSDEKGKTVAVTRNLRQDFEAAYARGPRGPVTKMIVRAERPSADNGAIAAGALLAIPGR